MRTKILSTLIIFTVAVFCFANSACVNAEVSEDKINAAIKKFLKTEEGQEAVGQAMQAYVQQMQKKKGKLQINLV